MRRNLDKPYIPWSVAIPEVDKTQLTSLLPMRGAITWIIEKGVRSFVDLMKASPDLRRWAHEEISNMMYVDQPYRQRELVDLNVQIPTELYMEFAKLFPENGSVSWFIRVYIHELVESLKADGSTLEERIEAVILKAMTPLPKSEPDELTETVHQGPDL